MRTLGRARDAGFMDATCARSTALLRVYGLWCWRLKLPIIWIERHSPRSKYARVCLEMFTTPNVLTSAARAEIERMCHRMSAGGPFAIADYDVFCDRVPLVDAPAMARKLLRIVTSAEGSQRRGIRLVANMSSRKRPRLVDMGAWGIAAGAD